MIYDLSLAYKNNHNRFVADYENVIFKKKFESTTEYALQPL